MKVAVTGASGHLGSAVIERLKQTEGITPIAIARTPSKVRLAVEIRAGDYNSTAQLDEAFQGVDAVLLVSGMAPPDERLAQHKRVIDSARRAGVGRLVFAGILVTESGGSFKPIQHASLATEEYLKESGLGWSIGRNGIYIEPDLEYLDNYRRAGKIANCAGEGRCAYTCRPELAHAYARMLTGQQHAEQTYVLAGQPITQKTLAACINEVFGAALEYESLTVEEYRRERQAELGDFIGAIIAGIYEGIRNGAMDVQSEFERVVGRPHMSPMEMIRAWAALQDVR
jgi:NAD(P)H dehydrogenase (quinone)